MTLNLTAIIHSASIANVVPSEIRRGIVDVDSFPQCSSSKARMNTDARAESAFALIKMFRR